MNNKIIIGIIVAMVLIGGGTVALSRSQQKNSGTPASSTTPENKTITAEPNVAMDADGGHETPESMAREKAAYEATKTADTNNAMMAKSGEYLDYSPETLKTELAEGHKVVLFFHAPWCPFCKAADAAFKAKPNQIPANVVVLKTDYDTNTTLKQKYGVTYQHTFVQVDTDGNMITKWNSGDVENLKKYLK